MDAPSGRFIKHNRQISLPAETSYIFSAFGATNVVYADGTNADRIALLSAD